jgi:hypothetical protein
MLGNRHTPRLCQTCDAPMARQTDTCWKCGATWATEEALPATLRLIRGGLAETPVDEPAYAAAAAVAAQDPG